MQTLGFDTIFNLGPIINVALISLALTPLYAAWFGLKALYNLYQDAFGPLETLEEDGE